MKDLMNQSEPVKNGGTTRIQKGRPERNRTPFLSFFRNLFFAIVQSCQRAPGLSTTRARSAWKTVGRTVFSEERAAAPGSVENVGTQAGTNE